MFIGTMPIKQYFKTSYNPSSKRVAFVHCKGGCKADDKYLYEMLILESFQAGLSWECVLNKREAFRKAYDGFDINKIVSYDEAKAEALMNDKGIIRNKRKI